jgi:hypothetical protein
MKITANIATYPPRKESLKRMLQSIEGQFDIVRIHYNEPHRFPDLADNGKFYALDKITEPEIYFCLDDDLIYPPDYVAYTLAAIKKYGCIVSHHGRRLLGEGHHYYKGHTVFTCLGHVQTDEEVDVPGSGCMAFDTRYFHPKGLADSPDLRMADLVFGLEAAKQKKQIGVLAHATGWIKHIDNRETIYETESRNGIKRQNEIADEIYRLNYEND